jgi:hypothetical protein
MKFFCQAALLSTVVVSSPTCGQETTEAKGQSGPPPVELKLTKAPLWKDNCLELSVQRTNLSKSAVFLDATYSEGLKTYSLSERCRKCLGAGRRRSVDAGLWVDRCRSRTS